MPWQNTTHDWSASVDADHLADIRRRPQEFAPGGALHLVLEVIAYAADEAAARESGSCLVTLHADGSVSVADDGRGTDTRVDENGQPVRKPVMSTPDLRFFSAPDPPLLPDGYARRGISVVAALSDRLLHLNRRHNGAWTQRYEHGVPVTDLLPAEPAGTTGTTVHFVPDPTVRPALATVPAGHLDLLTRWPSLSVEVVDERRRAHASRRAAQRRTAQPRPERCLGHRPGEPRAGQAVCGCGRRPSDPGERGGQPSARCRNP